MCTWLLSLLFGEVGLQLEEGSIYPHSVKIEEICWYAAKAAIATQLMEQEVIFLSTIMMAMPGFKSNVTGH